MGGDISKITIPFGNGVTTILDMLKKAQDVIPGVQLKPLID